VAARGTATYDPTDPTYFDPAALRDEIDAVLPPAVQAELLGDLRGTTKSRPIG
jgi:hypothetical protein